MITLYTFGPALGLPDPSPFVTKAEILLKMSGQPFTSQPGNMRKAPKQKLPYLDDDGVLVGDSTFIRLHLEHKYGIDFDAGLTPEQRATAWAFQTMAEEHLYWALVSERWMDDANFDRGPKMFFQALPALIRPLVTAMIRKSVRRTLHGQGFGRHSCEEIATLADRDFKAISDYLGTKAYIFGDTPTAVDATLYAFVLGCLCPIFTGPVRERAERYPALKSYKDRMTARFYPELAR